MKRARGIALPGLAMAAAELPTIEGLLRLENPEIGTGEILESTYTLEDVAAIHLKKILASDLEESPQLIGISMGAMVLAVLATDLRSQLPPKTSFRFLSPSANTGLSPAAPDEMLEQWKSVRPGNVEDYTRVLTPFFSERFRAEHPDRFERYVRYRANGENNQSMKAFRRQTAALRAFRGDKYFRRLDPDEAQFIRGAADNVFHAEHAEELHRLAPEVRFDELPDVGHMMNFERPDLFGFDLALGDDT